MNQKFEKVCFQSVLFEGALKAQSFLHCMLCGVPSCCPCEGLGTTEVHAEHAGKDHQYGLQCWNLHRSSAHLKSLLFMEPS